METKSNVDENDRIVVSSSISVSFSPLSCSLVSAVAIETVVDDKKVGCVVIGISSSLAVGRVARFSSFDPTKQV